MSFAAHRSADPSDIPHPRASADREGHLQSPFVLERPHVRWTGLAAIVLSTAWLSACSGPQVRPAPGPSAGRSDPALPAPPIPGRRGGYYSDDGPAEGPPPDLATIPDAVPRREPLLPRANRPYVVFGKSYVPMTELAPWRERGMASWYGRKYHGLKTSSGEPYDMFGMTAAHPTLPIPSYVRVTSVRTGRSVIVRVNDRGPFLQDRVIDLSFTAASKLGYVNAGSAEVEVESITRFDGSQDAPVQTAQAGGPSASAAGAVTGQGVADAAVPQAARGPAEVEPKIMIETTVTPSPASSSTTAAAPARGVWLQLGAFGNRENAEVARARLIRQIEALQGRVEIIQDGAMFKVHAGPYGQREEALNAAERIRQATEVRPFAVSR